MGFATATVGLVALRKAVNEEHKTTKQWCWELGISRTTWYEILKGEKTPSEEIQRALNRRLGIVNDWLQCDEQYEDEEMLDARGL